LIRGKKVDCLEHLAVHAEKRCCDHQEPGIAIANAEHKDAAYRDEDIDEQSASASHGPRQRSRQQPETHVLCKAVTVGN
jgi:hypothetical protein